MIRVTSNTQLGTFTIRVYENKKVKEKYRTVKFNRFEFRKMINNTNNDWLSFLRTNSNEYFKVK